MKDPNTTLYLMFGRSGTTSSDGFGGKLHGLRSTSSLCIDLSFDLSVEYKYGFVF